MMLTYTTPLRTRWVPARRRVPFVRWGHARSLERSARRRALAASRSVPSAHAAWPRTSALTSPASRFGQRRGRRRGPDRCPARRRALRRNTDAPRQPIAVSRTRANARPRNLSSACRSGSAKAASSGANAASPVRPGADARRTGVVAEIAAPHPRPDERTQRARNRVTGAGVTSLMQRVASIVWSPRSAPVGQTSTQARARAARRPQRRIGLELQRRHDLAQEDR